MKRSYIKKTMIVAMTAAMLVTTACNKEIKVDYGYNPEDYIELGEYKGVPVTVDRTAIEEEYVNAKIQEDIEINTTYEAVERGALEGDQVMFTYSGSTEGVQRAVLSNTTGYTMILGRDEFEIDVPEIVEAVYGMKTDESKVITVTLSEGYKDSSYAGTRVVFDIKVLSVGQPNIPMLTDAYAKKFFNIDTFEEYKQRVKKDVQDKIDSKIEEVIKTETLKNLETRCKVKDYPDKLIDQLTEQYDASIGFYASYAEMSKEDYCQKTFGMTFEEYVRRAATQTLMLQVIVKKEKIRLWEYEYKGDLEEFAHNNGFSNKDTFLEKFGREAIVEGMINQKAQNLVIENAVVTYK